MPSTLRFRDDYAETVEGRAELAQLIFDVFELDISPLDELGHDPSIVAFGWWEGGDLVANVSLYERRLWLRGQLVTALGVQSVAVRPEWRGRGLFRDLMTRALAHADARVALMILATATPDLYAPFGFRQIEESYCTGATRPGPAYANARRLSLESVRDRALLRDLFARRTPTSYLAAACDHPALFLLKAIATPEIGLVHLPALDAVVAVRDVGPDAMTLLDIVAPAIPPLPAIAGALGCSGADVTVMLTPDRLAWTPAEHVPIDTGYMVRGHYPPEGDRFMLSDMII